MSDDDVALLALTDFLNAVEVGIQDARQRIKDVKVGWDPNLVLWEKAEGSRGEYERAEEVDNPEFKAMVKDLEAHQGTLTREGYFYWKFDRADVVGRKPRR